MQKSANNNEIQETGGPSALCRKLMFRSWHRGTREMDLIMGRFADAHLPAFNDAQLAAYEAVMEESDPDLYNWVTGREAVPLRCDSAVMRQLIAFYNGGIGN